ncbi:autotransporter-associated beta strand repeat-containing protein [Sandarakinorhabdus sp.]|uniref:autotransporter-associated beta strand repeat-containing protein n=1 Tax=Sandarakinorhabdus sp. TaxID=1916663 RepID=UPI0028B0F67C|nr:autotransporter-associated beta strand repeat-containing protein [Sandarakinorhabdus sp.]
MNWDGTDFTAAVPGGQGGNGVWNATNTNWTGEAPGEINATWQNNAVGIFGGTGGSVDVASNFNFAGLGFQADGYVLNDAGGSLNTNSTLGSFISVDGGLTATINATIGGTGQLFKQGAGTLVLGGNNTLTGDVNLANGTLAVTSNGALGLGSLIATGGTTLASGTAPSQGTITLASNVVLNGLLNVDLKGTTGNIAPDGTLTADGNNLVLNGTVSGAGGLSVGGFGALVLNGANTYTGGTLATFAAIYVGTDSALGTGALTLNNGVLGNASGATRTLANNIVLAGDGTVLGPNDLVLNGTISGAGSLTKQTTSTLTLNGINSYADGTDLFGGTIVVGTNSALGAGQLRVEDAGQTTTLRAGIDGLNVGNAVVLGTNANLIVDSQAFNFTLSGAVGGVGALTKVGSGNLNLTNANGYSGGTLLNAGSISVFTNTSLGGGSLIMQDGTSLIAGANALSLANAAVLNGNSTVNTNGFVLTMSGILSGSGTLVKAGTGPLILSGTNSYSGGTSLNTGAIVIANNSALGTGTVTMADSTALVSALANTVIGNNIVTLGNGTLNTLTNNFTINGIISGAGSITKVGTGNLFLNGANSYAGGTALNAGTITVGNNAALGTGTLTMADVTFLVAGVDGLNVGNAVVTLGNGTIDTGANVFTLSGILSGAGSFTKIGSGNLILTNANTYAGGTALNVGTVTVANNSALGTGTLTMAGGTTLAAGANGLALANAITTLGVGTIDTAGNMLTLNGVIDGAGSLNKVNTGNLVLNGANLYAGGTTINGGTVTVGTNTALGTGGVVMADGTMLRAGVDGLALANLITINGTSTMNTQGFTFTLNGVIDGAGALAKIGTGTLVLNGANTYAGGTALNAGTIRVGNNSALGIGTLTMADGTTLASGAADLVLANAITTLGVGNIDTAGNTLTLNGVIDGAGSLTKVNTGNLVLNGANTYPGGTSINGGTVTVGTNAALGTGGVVMADGTMLRAGVDGLALANLITINGTSTMNTQGFTFTLNGVIDGAGTLAKIGTGTLVLNGANTYAGGTALNAGTIRVGNNSALGTGNLAMAAGTFLQAGAAGVTLANSIGMAGGATVDVAGQTLTLGGVISGTGPLSVIDSAANPASDLTLTGVNTYTGGTVVTGTQVRVSQDANLGNAAGGITLNGGTLWTTASFSSARAVTLGTGGGTARVAPGTALTLTGVVSGTSLTKIGGGELVLNSANTYAGGTTLTMGRITVGNNAALGTGALAMADGTTLGAGANNVVLANAISTAGVGTVDTGTNTLTLAGVVSGPGSIAKVGTGNLVLNGANTYAGGTALNAGTITVGNNAGLGTGVLTMADATTLSAGVTGLTVANNIVTLGAATINSGASPSAFTLSGVISGAGSVSKTGTGILTLSGASTYTATTTVAAGALNVTGSLVSAVTVNSGAALNGTGTVGALNVLAGGSVNPGASGTTNTATLTVTGAATLAGTYNVNVIGSTNDRITAGGALTLGGTLAVAATTTPAFPTFNALYTVASGATRTGTFATTTGLETFGIAFNPVVEYTTTQANIRLAPQSLVTLGNRFGGISGNALEVAQAFDRAVAGGYNPQAFFAVYANAGSNLPRTLREMSGEQRATERRVVLDSNRVTRETAFDRLNLGMASMAGQQVSTSDGDSSLTFWLRGAGTWGKAQTSGAATSFQTEQLGLLTGIDWSRDTLTVGGMFHYTTTNVEFGVLGGSSRVESVGGAVYAGWRQQDSGFVINAGVSLAGARTNGSRAITLAGFTQSLAGSTTGTTYQVFGELAFDLAKGTNTRIEPFVRNAYIGADIKALTETGGIAALTAPRASYNINVTNAGMRFGTALNGKIDVNASAAWQRTSGAREAATQIGIPAVGQLANIRSVSIDKDALLLQAGLGANLSDKIRIGVDYSGLIGARNDDHGGRATLNFAF